MDSKSRTSSEVAVTRTYSNKERFWSNFFGNGNLITADMIREKKLKATGQQYLSRVKNVIDRDLDLPVILPVRRGDPGGSEVLTWYAFVSDYRRFRTLGMELRSTLGTSYSDFEPRSANLDLSDGIEAAVSSIGDRYVYRFKTRSSDYESVLRALNVLYQLWESAPQREWDIRRPTNKILREFEFAVLAFDSIAAERCIEELANQGGMDAHNLLFMRIRLLSSLGRVREILELEDLDSLLGMRRPGLVTDAILAALFDRYWIWRDDIPEFQELRECMDTEIRPRFAPLLSTGRVPLFPNARNLLVWDQITRDISNEQRIEEIVAASSALGDRNLLETMVQVGRASRRVERKTEAPVDLNALLDRGDSQLAFEMALGQSASAERTALLFRCALDLQTPESAVLALDSFEQLQAVDQEKLRKYRWFTVSMPLLESQCVGLPHNWSDWLSSAVLYDRALALDRLDQALATWIAEGQVMSASEAMTVARDLLANKSDEVQQTIVEAIPRLVDFALSGAVESTGVHLLLDSAFDLLAIESDLRLPELETLSAIFEYQLDQGMAATQYDDRIEAIIDIWGQVASPLRSSWAISVIGFVSYSPIPNEEAMVRLVSTLTDSLMRMGARLDSGDMSLIGDALRHLPVLESIAARVQVSEEESVDNDAEWWRQLSGKTIGIYSLMEGSTRAVSHVLHEWLPELDVRINHDKVATTALDNLATDTDILVVAWASAKHAATQRLRSLRPDGLPLVWAAGSGSSSILRALREALDKDSSLS